MNNSKRKYWRVTQPRRTTDPSLFQLLTPMESRMARAIAVKAARSVIG
ncbi:MAG: hypothetical protein ACR2JJ_09060 [Sphingomicrobium sp.]